MCHGPEADHGCDKRRGEITHRWEHTEGRGEEHTTQKARAKAMFAGKPHFGWVCSPLHHLRVYLVGVTEVLVCMQSVLKEDDVLPAARKGGACT